MLFATLAPMRTLYAPSPQSCVLAASSLTSSRSRRRYPPIWQPMCRRQGSLPWCAVGTWQAQSEISRCLSLGNADQHARSKNLASVGNLGSHHPGCRPQGGSRTKPSVIPERQMLGPRPTRHSFSAAGPRHGRICCRGAAGQAAPSVSLHVLPLPGVVALPHANLPITLPPASECVALEHQQCAQRARMQRLPRTCALTLCRHQAFFRSLTMQPGLEGRCDTCRHTHRIASCQNYFKCLFDPTPFFVQ